MYIPRGTPNQSSSLPTVYPENKPNAATVAMCNMDAYTMMEIMTYELCTFDIRHLDVSKEVTDHLLCCMLAVVLWSAKCPSFLLPVNHSICSYSMYHRLAFSQ